jgi:putative spermidine/putrescine transport system ATP-binding protein
MSHLRLINVCKQFGPVQAVMHASLDVEEGEFVSLLGPSGSGKTTTLMMIAGFEELSSGSILIADQHIEHVPPNRRNIGMVFQNYALFPHLSVAANIGFPLEVRKRPRAEIAKAVMQALALVGLSDKADRLPRQLSGGQQQRVALARALVYEPKLLLLDEPLSALDKSLREQMQIELRRIHRQVGVTTLYVTHDQSEAMTLSDRIVIFNRGRIEQVGPPLEVYMRPRSRFAATFIGDSNIFDGGIGTSPTLLAMQDGSTLEVPHPLSADRTGAASVLVRPEDIRIGMPDGSAANALSAQVASILNMGSYVLVVAQSSGRELRIRSSLADLGRLQEGATIPIWWPVQCSWPIPASTTDQ